MPLLADEQKSLLTALGVWVEKSLYGRKYMGVDRSTFVVNSDGVVVHAWSKVKPKDHATQVLAWLEANSR